MKTNDVATIKTKCPLCDGDGYILVLNINDELVCLECDYCQGTGEVEAEEPEDE